MYNAGLEMEFDGYDLCEIPIELLFGYAVLFFLVLVFLFYAGM